MEPVQGPLVCNSYQGQMVSKIFDAKTKNLDRISFEKCGLLSIPNEILPFVQLRHLSLYGNRICLLPDVFFCSFPQLIWLDLRFNLLSAIPPAIKKLARIKNFLIGYNNIRRLCLELGGMESLIGLNIEGNPLQFPSRNIIRGGSKCVLNYLRECYAKRADLENEIKAQTTSANDLQACIDELAIGNVNKAILARESAQGSASPPVTLPSLFKSKLYRQMAGKLQKIPEIRSSGIFAQSHQSQRHDLTHQSGGQIVSFESLRQNEINERTRRKCRWNKMHQDLDLQRWKDREIVNEWKTSYRNKQNLLLSTYQKKMPEEIKEGGYLLLYVHQFTSFCMEAERKYAFLCEESRNRIRVAPFGVNPEATIVISSVELEKLKTAARPAILPDLPPRPRSKSAILQLEKDRRCRDNVLIDAINEQVYLLEAKMGNPCLSKSLADAKMDLVKALRLQLRLRNRRDILTQLKTATNPTAFMQ